jgi:NAD(P)-dependent dehydrogenase (short-subunit alcohol dehydrogenase family)
VKGEPHELTRRPTVHPEGPGSVSGASDLPAGFTDTFPSRYIDIGEALGEHMVLALEVARNAAGKMRPEGALLLMGGTGGRKISRELGIASGATAALPPFTAALALELAPVRVNLIAAGFVDTPLRKRQRAPRRQRCASRRPPAGVTSMRANHRQARHRNRRLSNGRDHGAGDD